MKVIQEKISVEDWIAVQDNPQQRDTEQHARKARKNHLAEYCETHSRVALAELPNGVRYKLDGHTRAYLWEHDFLERPDKLLCDVYLVKDKMGATKLYEHFDNSMAVETAGDKLNGALRFHNVKHSSAVFRVGGVTTALKSVYTDRNKGISKVDIKDCMKPFVKALNIIDSGGYAHLNFPAPVFAALLLTVVRDGNAALSFWDAYNMDEGKKTPKNMDAVFALTSKIRDLRDDHQFTRGSRRACILCVPKLLAIYEKWGGKLFKKMPKEEGDFKHYVFKYCDSIAHQLDWKDTML